jgi:hypothetical protein
MASEVSITRRDAYLFVHVQGDPLTKEERRSTAVRMLDEAIEANLDIVIHEDTPGGQPFTAAEYVGRANFLATTDFRKRIAYVPPAGMPFDTYELIENAAWNLGKKVRLFSRLKDAIKWIESPEEDTG